MLSIVVSGIPGKGHQGGLFKVIDYSELLDPVVTNLEECEA